MCTKHPELRTVYNLTKEFILLHNSYLYTPRPGFKLNQQWWLDLLATLPKGPQNKLLVKGIKYGVSLGIKKNHKKLLNYPTNIIWSVQELEQLLKVLIKDIYKRNKQPVYG